MINKIWLSILVISIVYSIFTNNLDVLNKDIISAPNKALQIILSFFPMLVFWSGILGIAKDSGFLKFISKFLKRITTFLFPSLPKDHIVHDYISGNMAANLMGLGSAATPMGLKAIKEMQLLNKNKTVATRPMITLLLINTSSLTIIPTTIIALRYSNKAAIVSDLIPFIILATSITTISAIIIDKIFRRFYH